MDSIDPFYSFNTVYNNFILNKYKVTFRQRNDIFWRVLNKIYMSKYFKDCKNKIILRYIHNNFDIAEKSISNYLEETEF